MPQPLDQLVHDVATLLSQLSLKVVFAESCTAGLVSASLARVPGISNFHCGSAVVYRLDTKTQWLGIPQSMLIDPGAVSEPVARAMAERVLAMTPEADFSVSITGHLGPNAPNEQDGLIFVGIAVRGIQCRVFDEALPRNRGGTGLDAGQTEREQRQWAAVEFVLKRVADLLRSEAVEWGSLR